MAGALRRCPVLIHEQNAVPGVSNKILGKVARRVCLSMPESAAYFAKTKVTLTGNPVRAGIMAVGQGRSYTRGTRRLLVVGGSQGARALNEAIIKILPALKAADIEIWHQTGELDADMVKAAYAAAGFAQDQARVEPFIVDMAEAYAWADLGLMRSGASSVTELAVAGLPAVLIPFPFATHNHQVHNARFLSEAGAAILVEQKDLNAINLGERILGLLENQQELQRMGTACAGLGQPEAAARVFAAMRAIAPGKHWDS